MKERERKREYIILYYINIYKIYITHKYIFFLIKRGSKPIQLRIDKRLLLTSSVA